MTHKEKLIKIGLWEDFKEAFETASNHSKAKGVEGYLSRVKDSSLSSVISGFTVWRRTSQGDKFWVDKKSEIVKMEERGEFVDISKIIKEM